MKHNATIQAFLRTGVFTGTNLKNRYSLAKRKGSGLKNSIPLTLHAIFKGADPGEYHSLRLDPFPSHFS